MSDFERLHPALQHHIVNTLGWSSLRPLQEVAIEPILAGEHAILVAPTAGGKTEAAFFPVLSRLATARWPGLGVLYVCPLRALLNDLERRIAGYCAWAGRTAALWHGDVSDADRRRILAEPPSVLLITPESIEVMLVSRRVEHRALFANLRCAIVDEVHAFAGDDRGWHLLALLERLTRIAGRDIQRLGLSATVGNPDDLLGWLAGSAKGPRRVLAAAAAKPLEPEIEIDSVATIPNAARVIAGLHAGEKRLVFCDSRSRVEELAVALRRLGTDTYVSHSSVSLDERRRAEAAFAQGRDCVIVATSTLELGIDVGDLDRVIQIDAPSTVSAFLQRMGRTGRRPGARPNILFLATDDEGLLRAAGLTRLRAQGFVEPITPPPLPFHILAQQIMALSLQERGIGRTRWREWLLGMPAFAAMPGGDVEAVVRFMLEADVLFEDGGTLSIGAAGEEEFGWRNFIELLSVFTAPPLFRVMHGEVELGEVHRSSFEVKRDAPPVLLLAGRSWVVRQVEWKTRTAYVEPARDDGKSRWPGEGQPLRLELCHAIRDVLGGDEVPARMSRRASEHLEALRERFAWVTRDTTAVVREADGSLRWWTFAGLLANAAVRRALGPAARPDARTENLAIALDQSLDTRAAEAAIQALRHSGEERPCAAPVSDDAIEGLKFSSCLPRELALRSLRVRLTDEAGCRAALAEPTHFVACAPA